MNLSSFSQLPDFPKPETKAATATSPVHVSPKAARKIEKSLRSMFSDSTPPKRRESVAGGSIKWRPIDAAAGKLISKADQIYHPPPQPITQKVMPQPTEVVERFATTAEVSESVAATVISKAKSGEEGLVKFANNAAEAKVLLEQVAAGIRCEVADLRDELPKAIKGLREWRMAITSERDLSLRALEDIRKFFLGADHEKEMARLESFIRTCERLRSLAADGTLEKVSDVMLKLA